VSADPADALGGRLPLADPATLTGEQRAQFDRMMARIVPWADEAGFQSTAAPPAPTPDQEATR
jgi:4-carboxymuconolactone decarboxylase